MLFARNTKIQSQILYESLRSKMESPETVERASLWFSKSKQVQTLSGNIYNYIDSLKDNLLKETGEEKENAIDNNANRKLTAAYFKEQKKSDELYDRLKLYIRDVMNIDKEINKEFQFKLYAFGMDREGGENDKKIFREVYFDNVSLAEAVLVLSNFQAGIRTDENQLVNYCHDRVNSGGSHSCITRPWPMATLSSSYVKPGEPIEVTVGIGMMNGLLKPSFTINNRSIEMNESGVAVYKINTKNKAGKYAVPVKIQYTQPDGSKSSLSKELEYEVYSDSTKQ